MRLFTVLFLGLPWAIAGVVYAGPNQPPPGRAPLPAPRQTSVQYGSGFGNVTVFHVTPAPSSAPVAPLKTGVAGGNGPPGTPGAEEDTVAELMRLRAEQQKAWSTINANNPMSADYGNGAPGAPGGTGPFEQINRILSQPAVQAYMRFFNNPVFSKGAEQIINSPRRLPLLYAELGLILFMLILRAWRYSKSEHWAARLWTRIWTLAMFWFGALVALPWIVLGEPYYQTLAGGFEVLLSYIKK